MRPTDGPRVNGPALRAIREALDIPAARMADDLGLSRAFLSMIERGHRGCRPAVIWAMARYLNVAPSAICTWADAA